MTINLPPSLKKIIISSSIFGLSFAIVLGLLFVGFLWYESRPKPPNPWNKNAITAEYDLVDTEGEKNTIVFYYTLQNNTDYDYTIEDNLGLVILAKLEEQSSLSGSMQKDKWLRPDYSVFIPAKKRVRFAAHLDYTYNQKIKTNATREERRVFRKQLENYIHNDMSNLDGFVIFDENKRFEIDLSNGWSHAIAELFLPIKENEKFGYIDNTGKYIIKPKYDDAELFSEGLAVVRIGDKYGYISDNDSLVIKPTFDFASSFSEGLASVNIGGESLFGKISPKPSNTKRKSIYSGGKYGYVDHSGKLVIPYHFEEADDFCEGLARVKVNGKWGFIDKQGSYVVQPEYDLVFDYSDGIATVEKSDKVGYVDKNGNILFKPIK